VGRFDIEIGLVRLSECFIKGLWLDGTDRFNLVMRIGHASSPAASCRPNSLDVQPVASRSIKEYLCVAAWRAYYTLQ